MEEYLLTARSVTHAQRMMQILKQNGYHAAMGRSPVGLSGSGCGYAVSLYRHLGEAATILKKNNMLNGKLFKREENGEYTEVRLNDLS